MHGKVEPLPAIFASDAPGRLGKATLISARSLSFGEEQEGRALAPGLAASRNSLDAVHDGIDRLAGRGRFGAFLRKLAA